MGWWSLVEVLEYTLLEDDHCGVGSAEDLHHLPLTPKVTLMHAPEGSADTQGSSLLEVAVMGLASTLKFNPRSSSAPKSKFTFGISGNAPFCGWAEVPEMKLWDG